MKPAIILLMILVAGGAIVWLIDRLFYHKERAQENDSSATDADDEPMASGCADEGCGLRPICPSEQLLAGQCDTKVTYYDDEELDLFAGRADDAYSPDEVDQWRDVLYTLRPSDLMGWGQSVKHRGLTMHAAIRDEFMQLVAEYRSNPHQGQ
jgi:hypothetical protein